MNVSLLNIVIVGGGIVGWMVVNLFVKCWQYKVVSVILVELLDIGIIGVGEGLMFMLKCFFEDMNIVEFDWMVVCNVIYKVSIQFDGWSFEFGVGSYVYLFISQLDIFSEWFFYVNCLICCMGFDVNVMFGDFLFNGWLVKYKCLF